MLQLLFPSTIHGVKAYRRREDRPSSLSCLYGPRCETLSSANTLDMIDNRYLGVAREDKVAVHAMREEVFGNGSLRGRKTLCDHCAAIDSSCAGRVP